MCNCDGWWGIDVRNIGLGREEVNKGIRLVLVFGTIGILISQMALILLKGCIKDMPLGWHIPLL